MADEEKMTVTMSMKEFREYDRLENRLEELLEMLIRANKNGKAVMTDELKKR